MKILLVNPNRYRTPPVPPLALEYLAGSLDGSNHEYRILDLCFEDDPIEALECEINEFTPHIAGITVRNIDTVIYYNNVFFLDEIKSFVKYLKTQGIPVIVGGIGYSFIPEGILKYLGADWGVIGPGERTLPHILDRCEKTLPPFGMIFNGWEMGIEPGSDCSRCTDIDYKRYAGERGLAGFETQKGCFETCSYCPEGNKRVIFKNPVRIVDELSELARRGITDFHLCDTEFNQDLAHCKAFLEALISKGPEISWTPYMKVSPYDDELFSLMKNSGVHLLTLSVPTGKNSLEHTEAINRLAKKHGIKLAVDFLCGFPGETVESVRCSIETLRRIEPETVGINAHFRLYPNLSVTREVLSSPAYEKNLFGAVRDNPELIKPVFYNHITADTLRELTGDDALFTIEGFERTSNYERINRGNEP